MAGNLLIKAGVSAIACGLVLLVVVMLFSPEPVGVMIMSMFRRRKQETTMTQPDQQADQASAADTIRTSRVDDPQSHVTSLGAWGSDTPFREMPAAQLEPEEDTVIHSWGGEGIRPVPIDETPYGDPTRVSASRAVPRQRVTAHREACVHCQGAGYMPSINDYLRESAGLLGDQADEVIRSFYTTLFGMAPELVKLFPGNPTQGDLGTDHKGAQQREKLLGALVALADLYDPDDGDKMARLDTALTIFGRSHASFVRQDGTIKGATLEEYVAVKEALFATLVRATGDAWRPEFTESWSQAYDYAATVMLAEQYRSGFSAPRFPRG
jgi:hemoglobin-like flavoprotein